MKKKQFRSYFFSFLVISFFHASLVCQQDDQEQTTSLQKIADINLNSFPCEDNWWSSDSLKEFLVHHEKERFNPKPRQKREAAFLFFQAVEKTRNFTSLSLINDSQTWADLDLFAGKTDAQKSVAWVLDQTHTEFGRISLYWLLSEPTADTVLLEQRQHIIKTLLDDKNLTQNLDALFLKLQAYENILLSFWTLQDPLKSAVGQNYFKGEWLQSYNDNNTLLCLKSLFDHQSRVSVVASNVCASVVLGAYGLLLATGTTHVSERFQRWADSYRGAGNPLLGLFWWIDNKWAHVCGSFITALLCASYVPHTVEWMSSGFLLEKFLHRIMNQVAQSFTLLKTIAYEMKQHPSFAQFQEFKDIVNFLDHQKNYAPKLKLLIEYLETDTLQEAESLFSNKGTVLAAYELMSKLKTDFEQALAAAGRMEAYLSLAKTYQTYEQKRVHFSFAKYAQAEKPFMRVKDFWHPLVPVEKVVSNSLTLGVDQQRSNLIVTGPNEGGKSTVLKAITLCLLLGQTIGIVPARECIFTPFTSIATYLNITDDIGAGNSLFKAEVVRTQNLIERIKNLTSSEFSFVVFDEIFNGTSPREGGAAAYCVAKFLSTFPNNICLIATHFSLLTSLETATHAFTNAKVSVIYQYDGTIGYPYKLEPGISHQHVAIDILRNQGFSNAVLDEAEMRIKQRKII